MKQFLMRSSLLLLSVMLLVACGDNGNDTDGVDSGGAAQQLGPLEWGRSADNVVLRVDERLVEGEIERIAMEIPPCTLWGDGRVVWVNDLGNTREVLEARVGDDAIRSLIETVVFSGYFDWESDFIIPEINSPSIESITLNLEVEQRTVSRYGDWPVDGYRRILNACRQLSNRPVSFLPSGAWISATEVPRQEGFSYWRWLRQTAGFGLAEVAEGNPPQWVTGDLIGVIWENAVEPYSPALVLDDERAYRLIVQVPRVMRDAPPEPSADATRETEESP